ncbi:MAG: ABC transporter permease subunit, partial [Phycisphaerae bacterium]
ANGIQGMEYVTDTFMYLNDQPASLLWYHDHTMGSTRFKPYLGLAAAYPFIYTLSISLSSPADASRNSLHLWPAGFNVEAYRRIFQTPEIMRGYINSIIRTVLGTFITVLATCLAAYPLSRKQMPHRGLFLFMIVFTMLFNGGMVPAYLLVKQLGMINTVWALVIPSALSAFNIIIVKNFFQQIPESLHEAARIDGASELTILCRIYLPLSLPVLATLSLWTAVSHWNQWFDAMLYITDDRKQVLQLFLQRIVIENSTDMINKGLPGDVAHYSLQTLQAAAVVITILPMLALYPLAQRYFIKGITLGGIKE